MTNDGEKMEGGSLKRSRANFEAHGSTDNDFESDEFDASEEEEWWREDESHKEQDIEEHEFTTFDKAQTVKIRLFMTDEDIDNSMWMKNFVAECTYDDIPVAGALARYIHREAMRSEFWQKMEEVSSDMSSVAFEVFDRYGTVQAKYKGHPVQRGTGVWRNELDDGPLFLIEEVHVTALEQRHQGLGRRIVSLLLDKARRFCLDEKGDGKMADLVYGSNEAFERAWTLHALTAPGYLSADIDPWLWGKSAEKRVTIKAQAESDATYFWRAISLAFFLRPPISTHAQTKPNVLRPKGSTKDSMTGPFTEVKSLKMERLRDALPLQHAALTLPDNELKAFFEIHADDKIGWDRVTTSEATLLHLTACELKPLSTRWLLENVSHADSWMMARDIDRYTPFEALQEKLETMRTQKQIGLGVLCISDNFSGYPDTAVACLSLLSGRATSGLNDACLRYGCTYGECIEGFLSARMRTSLISQGETNYDFMQDHIDDGAFWIKENAYFLIHLDADVRKNLKTNKSLRKGFANIFEIAVECLQAKRIPTADNIEWCRDNRSEWPPHTQNYLRRAGLQMGCRAVLRYMFDAAKGQDEKAGDGEWQLTLNKQWSDLPTCRNDHEFEFVARACGYGEDDFM